MLFVEGAHSTVWVEHTTPSKGSTLYSVGGAQNALQREHTLLCRGSTLCGVGGARDALVQAAHSALLGELDLAPSQGWCLLALAHPALCRGAQQVHEASSASRSFHPPPALWPACMAAIPCTSAYARTDTHM